MSDISQNNNHVINYLDYYLNLDNPEYAVLINGDWGIGKTFLIKEYVTRLSSNDISDNGNIKKGNWKKWSIFKLPWCRSKSRNKEKPPKKIVHVSLNGLRSGTEVNEAITEELYPIWKNKWIKTISSVGGESIKMAANTQGVNLDSLNVKKLLNLRRSNITYIFDDLERCSMPLEDILGYINSFVEYDHCNVLIIANEEELRKKHPLRKEQSDTNNCNHYDKIKEKIIGKTLTLMPETENALNSFFRSLHNPSQDLFKWKDSISEIYTTSSINNLRILKQSIRDFERVYSILKKEHKKHDEFMKKLINLFFILSFEIKSGHLSCNKIDCWKQKDIEKNDAKEASSNPLDKYGNISYSIYYDAIFSRGVLSNIIEKGLIEPEEITKEINDLPYFNEESNQSWKKIWHWRDLTCEHLKQNLEIFEKEFKMRKFIDFSEILHIFGLRLYLSRNGIIDSSLQDTESKCITYINDISKNIPSGTCYESIIADDYAHGLGFFEKESEERTRLAKYLFDKANKSTIDRFIEKISAHIFSDNKSFKTLVHESMDEKYRDIPITKYFNTNNFCYFLLTGTTKNGLHSLDILLPRYYGRPDLFEKEKETWIDIRSHLENMELSSPWQQLAINDYISVIDRDFLNKKSRHE